MIGVLFFLFFICTHAQSEEKTQEIDTTITQEVIDFITTSDSLKKIRKMIRNTSLKNPDKALVYSKYFLKRGIKENNYDIQHYANFRIAYINYGKSKYLETIQYVDAAIENVIALNNKKKLVNNYMLKGSVFFDLGIFEKALIPFNEGRDIAIAQDYKLRELQFKANIGFCHSKLERHQDALDILKEVIQQLKKDEYQKIKGFEQTHLQVLLALGLSYEELNRLSEAIKTYDQGLSLIEQYEIPELKGDFYINYGVVYYKKEEYYTALGYLNEGRKMLSAIYSDNFPNILIAKYHIAECFYKLKQYDNALSLLQDNFRIMKETEEFGKLEEMYKLAIDIAEIQQKKDLAIALSSEHREIMNTTYQDQLRSRDILINRLQSKNDLLSEQKSTGKLNVKIATGIAITMFITLLGAFVWYRKKVAQNEKRFQELMEKLNSNLKNMEEKEEEKEHIHKEVIEDEKAKIIIDGLKNLENSSFFLSTDCNLYSTAKKINTNTTYLSKTLNEFKKQSFSEYLNEIRINHALMQLQKDRKFRSYTVQAIAQELGYKSVNTFTKAFKNKTNLNPSFYIKRLEKTVQI
ncbi:AraC family transcriptional regulator [Aquimarina sp. MMG016]|uniref:AraC family transcriptional regulator n=1 Tax=Aquimarina sp. MMG016 TaxID=2822690 RepID=UPI001B39D3E7|nr:AraC family transcriptional regulator [Aquimarina sp. MMG016]MBQ4819421.1 helix-turn-helix domain-containing protein [Aquimarina sp. MMG016]